MTIYSERFFVLEQPQVWASLVIPAETRAVIRALDCHNGNGVAGRVQVALATTLIFDVVFTSTPQRVTIDTRQVVYAGEQLAAFVEAAGMILIVSGYLFREASAARMPDAIYTEQLPA